MASFAHAGEHRFQLLLDTDNSAATGCVVATPTGALSGIEQVWTTVVTTTTSGANVTRIERQACGGVALLPPTVQAVAGWPAGLGNGVSATAAIETFIPSSFLPAQGTIKARVVSINATGGQDATASFAIAVGVGVPPPGTGAARPIPLSPWLVLPLAVLMLGSAGWWLRRHPEQRSLALCVVLVVVSGLVWAATVTLDGNVGDWNGIAPVAGNPKGSAPIDANIVAVFDQSDATNLYLRIDADVRPDAIGNQPPQVFAGADQTITLPATASLDGSAADDGLPNPPGALATTWSKVSGPGTVTFGNANALATTASFSQSGVYTLRLGATDGAASASDDVQVTVDTTANHVPAVLGDFAATTPGVAVQFNVLANDSDADGDTLTVIAFGQGASGAVACSANGACTYTPIASFTGQDTFTYTASDGKGGQAIGTVTVDVVGPDQTANAPPLKGAVATIVGPATSFLYSGVNPLQTGVAPGTIQPIRASVLRGKVTTRDGSLLPGVTVTILDHPEFGQTLTRSNGFFDMAVNGGGLLTVKFAAAGFLPVQKQVSVPWQDYVVVPQVALIPLDAQVTVITGNAAATQFHQSSVITDADGSRRVLVLFPAGTTATMTLPNGSTQPLSAMHIRATEYTVGSNGPMAMPGNLPPLSGYTYCVELSVDEAIAAGAVGVSFSQPVVTYVDNFLSFPVGTNVPVGSYDRVKGIWVPSPNGRTVKVLAASGGVAGVDTDGDGVADGGLGISVDERRSLASFYAPGQTLWRMPVSHFSPADGNWPYAIPDDAKSPGDNGAGPDPNEPLQDPHCSNGSIVDCENQVLGESVPIIGTPYTLNYRSDRVPGQTASRTIRLAGASVPASLASIELHLSVAGRSFDQTFPASANQQTTFVWDRLDVYGRQVLGGQTLSGRIDYNYPTTYKDPGPTPAAFNNVGGVTLGANPTRQQINISQSFTTTIGEGLTDARTIGLGGWTLSVHHVYDPNARVAHLGNGARRRAGSLARTLTTIDLPGQSQLFDVEVGPDGSRYVALPHGDLIVRVAPDGSQSIVAGNGVEGFSGDGGPATQAMLGDPTGIAIAPDGSLYIAEQANFRVRKVAPDGTISTVAGTGVAGFGGDGGPATLAQLTHAERVAVGADSTLYILDGQRIRRVTTDGIISTAAGDGTVGFSGDGGPATSAELNASSLVAAPDGGFYIADFGNHRVRRVGPDGVITTVADFTAQLGSPVSIRPTADASLLIALEFGSAASREVDLLKADGSVVVVAGGGTSPIQEGLPATQAALASIRAVALGPDGSIFIAPGDSTSRLLRIAPALPGFEGTVFFIASADGGQLYVFDTDGKHLRTLNALTGAVLFEFGYDAAGRLNQVTEKTGGIDNVTTINHDAAGNPTSIVGPFGQVTTLAVDGNAFLGSIGNPAGEAIQMTSDAGGLLATYTDPRGKTSSFTYDADGRLTHDADPLGGKQDLVRVTSGNQFVVTRTTALGRTTTYAIENLPGNTQIRTVTEADATQSQSREQIDAGATRGTSSDGSTFDTLLGPDPRFGMAAPVTNAYVIASPGGLTRTMSSSVTAALSNGADPLSLTSLTETFTDNGRTTHSTYTASTRTLAATTPAGRSSSSIIDSLGRLLSSQRGGLDPTGVTYDGRGRIVAMTRGAGGGARTTAMSYDAQGYLQSTTDPLGRSAQFTHDAAGRVLSKTLAGGGVAQFAYDAAGNMTSIAPPGRPAHAFTYSDRNQLLDVIPPAVPGTGPTHYAYNPDRQPTTIARPDGATVTLGYDAGARLATRSFAQNGAPAGADTLSYDTAGRLASIVARGGETTAYAYDGALLTGKTWSGPVAGSVTRSYDATFRVSSESVNGGASVAYTYDDDDLLTGAGGLAISRDPQNGLATASALGTIDTSMTFTALGEMSSNVVSRAGSTLFGNSVVRDAAGRIAQRVETAGGATATFAYSYASAGDLVGVSRNGVPIESYVYDASGNRTSATVGSSTVDSTYDDQDRLVQSGTALYTYNAAGDLASKASGGLVTTYQYDAMGNLLGATLPGGAAITYVVDGNNQRVGKRIDGALVRGYLYGDQLRVAAELDGTAAVVSRFVYAGGNVPIAMIKAGATLRIVTDQVGSVRLVVDAASGAIVQRMDYDSFGNVTLDTNPGFQPFGFAGGLYDADTGFIRFGLRDYDPVTGRWTTKDPAGFAGGDANLYRYVQNDPVNSRDPSGLDAFDTLTGFSEQLNRDVQLLNPFLLIDVLSDSLVRAAAVKLGVDPRDSTFFGATPPGYDHPPSLYEQLFLPPTTADRMSADYTKGELIAQCVEIGAAAADLVAGLGEAAGKLASKLNSSAAERAADELAQQVAERAGAPVKVSKAYAPESKGPGLGWVRPEGGGAGTRATGKAAGGFTTGR